MTPDREAKMAALLGFRDDMAELVTIVTRLNGRLQYLEPDEAPGARAMVQMFTDVAAGWVFAGSAPDGG